jgi:hypothetical protein
MSVTDWKKALRLIILLISAHSFVLGIAMLFFSRSVTQSFGFGMNGGVFWQSQSGIFLIILAIAYYLAYRELERGRILVNFLVISKGLAVLFLLTHYMFFGAPLGILFAAAGDGAMGLIVFVLNIKSSLEMGNRHGFAVTGTG